MSHLELHVLEIWLPFTCLTNHSNRNFDSNFCTPLHKVGANSEADYFKKYINKA